MKENIQRLLQPLSSIPKVDRVSMKPELSSKPLLTGIKLPQLVRAKSPRRHKTNKNNHFLGSSHAEVQSAPPLSPASSLNTPHVNASFATHPFEPPSIGNTSLANVTLRTSHLGSDATHWAPNQHGHIYLDAGLTLPRSKGSKSVDLMVQSPDMKKRVLRRRAKHVAGGARRQSRLKVGYTTKSTNELAENELHLDLPDLDDDLDSVLTSVRLANTGREIPQIATRRKDEVESPVKHHKPRNTQRTQEDTDHEDDIPLSVAPSTLPVLRIPTEKPPTLSKDLDTFDTLETLNKGKPSKNTEINMREAVRLGQAVRLGHGVYKLPSTSDRKHILVALPSTISDEDSPDELESPDSDEDRADSERVLHDADVVLRKSKDQEQFRKRDLQNLLEDKVIDYHL